MKSRVNESGSAVHIIVIIILVVGVLGVLGFLFWKNVTKTENNTAQTSSNSDVQKPAVEEVALVDKDLNTNDNLGITYKMPSTWTGGQYGGGDTISDSETTTLKSPDGFTITMQISRLTRGWTATDPMAKVLEVQKNSGTNLSWVVVDHANGSSGPISLQITDPKSIPSVGSEKVNGSSIYKLGEADGVGVYLEAYGSYSDDMSLEAFNSKESVTQAKTLFESIKLSK